MDIPKAWIEAGGKAIYDAEPNYEDDPVTPWENAGASTQNRYREKATACLAAVFERAEVVYTHTADHECEASLISDDQPIDEKDVVFRKGDTLVIVRGC